jgi:hypothetical protein
VTTTNYYSENNYSTDKDISKIFFLVLNIFKDFVFIKTKMQRLLYVSAFIDLNEDRSTYRIFEKSLELFKNITDSSIKMICFVSTHLKDYFVSGSSNIQFVFIDLEDLDTYKFVKQFNVLLPSHRNKIKDTLNFLILMNAKTEFIKKAMEMIDAEYYAWIDFNICHVFKDIPGSIKYLEKLQEECQLSENVLIFPGCWSKGYRMDQSIYDMINWRFCGGFFIGDKKSLENFVTLFDETFKKVVSSGRIMWETNIWSMTEYNNPLLNLKWIKADHDDTIIRIT